jgi:allantoate deiminase
MTGSAPSVNQSRLLSRLQQLAKIGRQPDGGITRLAWSAEDRAAVALVSEWAEAAGAIVRIDNVGNLLADCPGTVSELAPLITGSHLDTVISAGPLDGAYGVVAGIEVMACLHDARLETRHPLRVCAFVNEEGIVAPPFTGSRAVAGKLRSDELEKIGADGLTLAARLQAIGCDPAQAAGAAWTDPIAAMLELHIEQGPVLEHGGTAIGIVTGITSQHWGTISVVGEANHAGTTPMALRRDALAAGARVVLAVQDLATKGPADVATVGRIAVSPGATNVVPGHCELSFDVRAIDDAKAAEAMAQLDERLADIKRDTGCLLTINALPVRPAVATDKTLQGVIADVARARGLRAATLASGAGHDTASLVGLGPVGMIFVPSSGGISHNPNETTPDQALVDGVAVLLDALLHIDKLYRPGE